jgi:hypothetical protein
VNFKNEEGKDEKQKILSKYSILKVSDDKKEEKFQRN